MCVIIYSSNQLSTGMSPGMMTSDNADENGYQNGGMKIDLTLDDDPMQHYEDVEFGVSVNPIPIPPKPQAKRPLKKPAVTSTAHSEFNTSKEAFITFPRNQSDQFVKPLD